MPEPSEQPEIVDGIDASPRRGARSGATADDLGPSAREAARAVAEACGIDPSSDITVTFAPRASGPSPADAAIDWARSGAMALTGPADGLPRFAPGPLASVARGVGQVLTRLAPSGALDGLDAAALLGERAAVAGLARAGRRSPGGAARLLDTRDGCLALNLPREDDWRLVPAWLELDPPDRTRDGAHDWARLADLLAARETDALVARGRLIGLAVSPAPRRPPAPARFFDASLESERSAPARRRPLRVLDLSTLWAGPLATSLLAAAGADVVKVESPDRPDGARRGPPRFFDLMNAGKRSAALDLREPGDRSRFTRLLEAADVVVESARPRALAQLGFDATGWVSERPGRLWLSITGHGRDHEWIAYGDDAAAAAGLAWPAAPSADGEAEPCFCADAVADPLTGLHAAALLLARWQRGRGGLIDLPLARVAGWAAARPHTGLVVPVTGDARRARLLVDGETVSVKSPRARPVVRRGPPLAPPDAALLDAWTHPAC